MKVIKNKIFISLMSALCVIGLALGITFSCIDFSPKSIQQDNSTTAKTAPDNDIYWDESDDLSGWISRGYTENAWSGSGTESDPYLIKDARDLAWLSYLVYSGNGIHEDYNGNYYYYYVDKYFKQIQNIDVSAYWWQPIGTYTNRSDESMRNYFSGNYDGNGYVVSGIFTKNKPSSPTAYYQYQGMFGYVSNERASNKGSEIYIKNLGILDSLIKGGDYTGGIVGYAYNTIISKCYNSANIEGSNTGARIGGIVGGLSSNSIIDCYNTGIVNCNSSNIGGIVGSTNYVSIFNCYNIGSVSGSQRVGGIVGYASTSNVENIVNCYNIGSISGGNYTNGLCGSTNGAIKFRYLYYGGDCTLASGCGGKNLSSPGEGAVKYTDLNSTTYAKNIDWYTNESNWDSNYSWDFENTWMFKEGGNDGYPVLRVFIKEVTVTFNQQSGSGGTSSVVATPGSSMPSITVPSRIGYTFQGYYTGTNGSGTKYYNANGSSARSCDLSNDTTLYAYWTINNYTVTFDPNGGTYNNSTSITTKNYTYETTDTLGAATRDGYTFAGWLVTTGAGNWPAGTVYQSTTSYKNGYDNPTLTAQWTINSYTLTLNPNGGNINGSTGLVSYTQEFGTARTLPVPTREGYTFKGWRSTGSVGNYNHVDNLGGPFVGDSFFVNEINHVGVYNNSGNGTVMISRESASLPQSPFNTHVLKVSNTGTASPGLGGFAFWTSTRANAEFLTIFEAKIPVGYYLSWESNPTGDGRIAHWLTPINGTGDWETYVLHLKCGASGSFQTTNYFALHGPSYGTTDNPVNWYVSQASVYDCTGCGLNPNTIVENLSKETQYHFGVKDQTLVAMWETDVWTRHAADSFAGGDGSAENPYQIATAEQLAKLAKDSKTSKLSGKFYKITVDIDLAGHIWTGIGRFISDGSLGFSGTIDGGLHVIKNMTTTIAGYVIPAEVESYLGFVNYLDNGTLKNIIIQSATVKGARTGGLVGSNYGTIQNCIVRDSTMDSNQGYAGGLCAAGGRTPTGCIVKDCTIVSTIYAGGLNGHTEGDFQDCAVLNVTIRSSSGNTGIIVAEKYYEDRNPIACYGYGTVNGTTTKVMYGGSSAWGNWTYNSGSNNGYPMQSGLFWIGGESGSTNVYNYLKNTLGFTEA